MKIAPIARALDQSSDKASYSIVHTGQHYDTAMSDVFFEELGIPVPHYSLNVGSGSHAQQTAKIMQLFEPVCEESNPDCVVVVGDVNSTLACSIVAKKLNITVAHVEAGLRSGDREMPEEINRIVTDSISDLLFVTEPSGVINLENEGHPKSAIHFVGHVMIDNLFHQLEKLADENTPVATPASSDIKRKYPRYGVVTLHRPSNVDDREALGNLFGALQKISTSVPLIFPAHPRTMQRIREFELTIPDQIELIEPLSFMEFLNLWKDADVVLTDSGGLQEETTALRVPCLTLRENTERPITITKGSNRIVGTDPDLIVRECTKILEGPNSVFETPDLWDGRAASRIVDVLIEG